MSLHTLWTRPLEEEAMTSFVIPRRRRKKSRQKKQYPEFSLWNFEYPEQINCGFVNQENPKRPWYRLDECPAFHAAFFWITVGGPL